MQALEGFGMLGAGGDEVDPGGLHAGVPQHVGKLRHVPAGLVEDPGEEMAQVVGKDLADRHPRRPGVALHLRPQLFSGEAFAASGEKDLAGGGFLPCGKSRPTGRQK